MKVENVATDLAPSVLPFLCRGRLTPQHFKREEKFRPRSKRFQPLGILSLDQLQTALNAIQCTPQQDCCTCFSLAVVGDAELPSHGLQLQPVRDFHARVLSDVEVGLAEARPDINEARVLVETRLFLFSERRLTSAAREQKEDTAVSACVVIEPLLFNPGP